MSVVQKNLLAMTGFVGFSVTPHFIVLELDDGSTAAGNLGDGSGEGGSSDGVACARLVSNKRIGSFARNAGIMLRHQIMFIGEQSFFPHD